MNFGNQEKEDSDLVKFDSKDCATPACVVVNDGNRGLQCFGAIWYLGLWKMRLFYRFAAVRDRYAHPRLELVTFGSGFLMVPSMTVSSNSCFSMAVSGPKNLRK
jgi:hypothetical protein